MGALQFHQYHHQPQIFMTPISFSCNIRAASATTTLCLRSIISKCFSTSFPKLCTGKSWEIKAISRVSADELKEQWLNSLTCPPILKDPMLHNDETCGNLEVSSSNVESQWVIGIDPDVSGALAVLKPDGLGCSAQVFPLIHS